MHCSKLVASSVVNSLAGNEPIVLIVGRILSGSSLSSLSSSDSHSHTSASVPLDEAGYLGLSSAIPYLSFVIS